jgi:hypothetical protein
VGWRLNHDHDTQHDTSENPSESPTTSLTVGPIYQARVAS